MSHSNEASLSAGAGGTPALAPWPPAATTRSAPPAGSRAGAGTARPRSDVLALGISTVYLSLVVLIPIAAIVAASMADGLAAFWAEVTSPSALAALRLTFVASLVVVAINAVFGTIVAWALVRDDFPGQGIVNAVVDLPFALPTVVAGLILLAIFGPASPIGLDLAYTPAAVVVAMLFVTLPFVIRSVQPVLIELDQEMEEAAASLGASNPQILRRIVLPNLLPAILSGAALSFGKAVGEFGSIVLISGNIPFQTEVASVNIFKSIESDDPAAAAAVSVVLLVLSFGVLLLADFLERRARRRDV